MDWMDWMDGRRPDAELSLEAFVPRACFFPGQVLEEACDIEFLYYGGVLACLWLWT